MEGLKVKCTNCGQIRHETTEHYRPDQTPKGNFIRLIDPWKKWGWSCYDDEGEALSTTPCSLMTCPGCSAQLAPSGRLTIFVEPEKPKTQAEINQEKIDTIVTADAFIESVRDFYVGQNEINKTEKPKERMKVLFEEMDDLTCEICGKVCKSKLGLGSHMRSHKNAN